MNKRDRLPPNQDPVVASERRRLEEEAREEFDQQRERSGAESVSGEDEPAPPSPPRR
jgi:hypothetical protein